MNKFKSLAKKLIENKLWKNTCSLIQLIQQKNQNNRIVWLDGTIKQNLSCLLKTKNIYTTNNILMQTNVAIFASKDLQGFDLKGKFAIIVNDIRYDITNVNEVGILSNDSTIVQMTIKR